MFQKLVSNNRVIAYCAIILIGSLSSLPEDYRIDKRNILNQMFVKLGWFWTLALLAPLTLAHVKSTDRDAVSQGLLKLVTSTIIWYISVNTFQYIDDLTGFDISGHTFLLIFSNLIITSELRISGYRLKQYSDLNSRGKLLKVLPLILSLLWDFMLVQTAIYYHTIVQKAIAAMWAFSSWYLIQVLFNEQQLHSLIKPRGRGDRTTNEHLSVKS